MIQQKNKFNKKRAIQKNLKKIRKERRKNKIELIFNF